MQDIKPGMMTASPVYARNEHGTQVMLVRAQTQLSEVLIDRLHRYKVTSVMVYADEPLKPLKPRRGEYAQDLPKIEPVISEDLTTDALNGLQDLFAAAAGSGVTTAYKAVKQLDDVVDQLVETVTDEVSGLVHISQLKSYDDYTFHHSLSVAVLSIAIGRAMKLDKRYLRELGRTAILHDIGKILIPLEILNKPGKLTDEEFDIMRTHSQKGALYLRKEGIGDEQMWKAMQAHHEKMDGSGYPSGLKGEEIPLFARIISVADVYDAVTSYRPYRGPMNPSVAFELLAGDVGRAFEYNIVNAFAKTVEFYPRGTILTLTNGRFGVVTNADNTLRPILQMLDSGAILDLAGLDNLHLMVDKVEDNLEL